MFYIYSNFPEGDHMNVYEWSEMVEIFGHRHASDLRDGISIFANGGIHVNAAHAALMQAEYMLVNG